MSLVLTRMQDWRIKSPLLDKNMHRPSTYGALDFFISQTQSANSILSPSLRERALGSIGNTIKVPVLNHNGNVQVYNERKCVVPDMHNTSTFYTVVFKTYFVGFTMVPSLYLNNDIDYNHDFTRKMNDVTAALANELDKDAVGALEANKTQVFADSLAYPVVGNEIQVSYDERAEILGDLDVIMQANDYPRGLHIIGNAGVQSLVNKLAQHGLYNDVNKQLEYAGKVFHFTKNVQNEAGVYGSMFAVEDGNVGILTRVDREAFLAGKSGTHEWDIIQLPGIDLPVGFHYKEEVGDFSKFQNSDPDAPAHESTQDMTCVRKEFYGFSLDVAFIVAYNNDPATIANPIIKTAIESGTGRGAKLVKVVNDATSPVYTASVPGVS